MRSPFKFLDAYDLKDKEVFFGRDEEIASLYEMVNKNRLILVYGQSGTGKTSLVRCGLAGRFDVTDWYPILIRRGREVNESLRYALEKAMGGELMDTFADTIEELYAIYLRPVYLIFDQLEELFTERISDKEQETFINTIQSINEANLPCRILFVIREEYLAHLYNFEKTIPTLFDRRLRVEPMSFNNVSNVITNSCEKFNIELEQPEKSVRLIIDSISDKKSGIQLPYLQVYLDMLYREDYQRTYPNGAEKDLPPLVFENSEIKAFGAIGNVMKKFLEEQERRIMQHLQECYSKVPDDAVRQVLDFFVTLDGTKKPVGYQLENNRLVLEGQQDAHLDGIDDEMLRETLSELERSRILRSDDDSFELAHDSLAALIDQERSDEQRQLNEVRRRLLNIYTEHQTTESFLNRKQLDSIDEYLDRLNLDEDLLGFVEDSRKHVKWQEMRRRNARRLTFAGIALFAVTMLIYSIITYGYYKDAEEALSSLQEAQKEQERLQEEQQRLNYQSYFERGKDRMQFGDFSTAATQFEVALSFDSTSTAAQDSLIVCLEQAAIKEQFDTLMLKGNIALEENRLVESIEAFRSAEMLVTDPTSQRRVENRLDEVRVKMLPAFRESVEHAYIFYEAEAFDLARQTLRQARQIRPYLRASNIELEVERMKAIEIGGKGGGG